MRESWVETFFRVPPSHPSLERAGRRRTASTSTKSCSESCSSMVYSSRASPSMKKNRSSSRKNVPQPSALWHRYGLLPIVDHQRNAHVAVIAGPSGRGTCCSHDLHLFSFLIFSEKDDFISATLSSRSASALNTSWILQRLGLAPPELAAHQGANALSTSPQRAHLMALYNDVLPRPFSAKGKAVHVLFDSDQNRVAREMVQCC